MVPGEEVVRVKRTLSLPYTESPDDETLQQIHDRLDPAIRPSLVLMNPPFSASPHVDGRFAEAAIGKGNRRGLAIEVLTQQPAKNSPPYDECLAIGHRTELRGSQTLVARQGQFQPPEV